MSITPEGAILDAAHAIDGIARAPGMTAARATSKTIRELLNHLDENELVLPEVQRDFVWSRRSVMLLFDSLYRGLPIGHMLVWRARHIVKSRRFAHRPAKPRTAHDSFYGYLLDGQQRLTAIASVRDGDDEYPLVFNLWPVNPRRDKEETADDPFYWYGRWAEGDPWYVLVSEVLGRGFNALAYIKRLAQDTRLTDSDESAILERITRLQRIVDYPVGVTEFESERYEDATELFIRFNSTGKRLSKSDLALAQLALKVPGLGSEEMERANRRWAPEFRFTRPFLIQCLAAVHTGRLSLKDPKQVWASSPPGEIRDAWRRTERAISELLELLSGSVRWESSSWIPSFNALVPLVVILAENGSLSAKKRELTRTWLLLATMHRYFSGSGWTDLDRLLRKLSTKPTIKNLWGLSRRRLRRLRPSDFETNRISGPAMSLFISMIRDADARGWRNRGPLDGTVVGHNAKLQIHHFFPRALLRRHGWDGADIDTFANYTVLSAGENLDVATEEPATYLRRLSVDPKELAKQCIPPHEELWRVDRYADFLDARRKLLAERANVFLNV